MNTGTKTLTRATAFNLPNQVTATRLVLSIVLFVLLSYEQFAWGFALFVLAASTDWLDGYFARKYGLVTALGRVLDPFVDKVIVCGTFIYLAAVDGSGVMPWMVVVIVGRELLVTAIRSQVEGQGGDFSANMAGKLKMLLQCIAAGVSLFSLAYVGSEGEALRAQPTWLAWLLTASVWSAVLLTIYSGAIYVWMAVKMLRG